MKSNKEHSIYGLNNCISTLLSKKYTINSIVVMKDSIAESNKIISEYIHNNNNITTKLDKKVFLSKYDTICSCSENGGIKRGISSN